MAETDPRDALIVPRDTSGLSESTQKWLADLGPQTGPADVFARYRAVTALDDDREERERERRRSAALEAREDVAAVAWVSGDTAQLVTVAERFRDIAAMTELEDAQEDSRRAKQQEARAVQREQRIAELERELAVAQSARRRADWLASDRLEDVQALIAEAQRQRTDEPAYRPPYQRTYWR